MWKVAFWFLQFPTEHDALHAGGHQLVACPLAEGTLPTCPLDSISTNFLASSELAKELVRVSIGYRDPVPRNLLEAYEAPSDLLE